MSLTVEKLRKDAIFLEEAFYTSKKHKSSELMGVFSDIGRKLAKEKKTSVDLVRELRDV
jgi:hypothetical protein